MDRYFLLDKLPPYEDAWITVKDNQSVHDIIKEILEAHDEFAPLYDKIALYFDADTTDAIAKKLYKFCKANIRYEEESEEAQTTATPAGILTRGYGDCKHYSGFVGGILDSINRQTGKNIDWNYRFASYSLFSKTPHHVFIVVKDKGEEIWIDPTPEADNKTPHWHTDKKIKAMPLQRNIAGVEYNDDAEVMPDEIVIYEDAVPEDSNLSAELLGAIELLYNYGIVDENGNFFDSKLQNLNGKIPAEDYAALIAAREYVGQQAAVTGFFDDIFRGIKKVALFVPRNAFLSLVGINAFGYATKLRNAVWTKDGTENANFTPFQDKLYKTWYALGGDWGPLRDTIKKGATKNRILGVDQIGAAQAAVPAAWVATAAAVVAAIMPLVNAFMKQAQQQQMPNIDYSALSIPDNYGAGGSGVMDWVRNNPMIVLLAAGAAWFLLKKKK